MKNFKIKVSGTASDGVYLIRADECEFADDTCFTYEPLKEANNWLMFWLPYLIGVVVFVGVAPLLALFAYNLYYRPSIYKWTFTKKVETKYNVDF